MALGWSSVSMEKRTRLLRQTFMYILYFIFIPVILFLLGVQIQEKFLNAGKSVILVPLPMLGIFIALIFIFAGFGIFLAALSALRKLGGGIISVFSIISTKKLVTDKIYGKIRHPQALGYLIYLFGIALLINLTAFYLFVFPTCLIVALLYLVKFEEPALIRKFGDNYIEYMEKVPFLFPKKSKSSN